MAGASKEMAPVGAAPIRSGPGFPEGLNSDKRPVRSRAITARLLGDRGVTPYLFMLPFLGLYAVFLLVPILQGFYVSLTDWDMMRPEKPFVGLDNFRYLFARDSLFWPSVRATLAYILYNVPVKIILGLVFALALNQKVRGTIAFRTAIFVPFVINTAAIGLLGQWILDPQVGVLNYYLTRLGLPPQHWLVVPT